MNNNKTKEHKGKVCLIDGSTIYTDKRAQNVLEKKDVNELFELYTNYEDVIEKCKIVSIEDIDSKENTLDVSQYIEKKKQAIVPPDIIRRQYYESVKRLKSAEEKMMNLLVKGGYVRE